MSPQLLQYLMNSEIQGNATTIFCFRADVERAKKLLPCILYNDLIMRTIITNLPNFQACYFLIFLSVLLFQDRINLEKTSRYFRNISSKAPWKFTKLKNHLKLTYYVSVHLASV